MKRKILALGFLTICCVGWLAGDANAWLGLDCRHRYVTQITCRPYNAFTPICWGNLVCDGCCPNPCGAASGCLPMTMGVPPWACCPQPPCMPPMGMNPGACCVSDMPPPSMPMPDIRTQPSFTPPMPLPVNQTMMYPPMPNPIAQASYMPNYYPMYYPAPMSYQPAPAWPNYAVPYYWYQGR